MLDSGRPRLAAALIAAVTLFALVGAYAGTHLPDWAGDELERTRAALDEARTDLAASEGRVQTLTEQTRLQQAAIDDLTNRLGEREREIGNLQSALALSGPLTEQFNTLATELGNLKAAHEALTADYEALQAETASLVRIRTPELPGDGLLLDRSVPGVTYTGAVCSGSMEPNISCDDLLILYEPSVTDLAVGDIIYFRRQAPDCSGPLEDRFMLHRITRVTAGSEGLAFRTKGDALEEEDPCAVPAGDVLYKLLTNVRDARIPG